MGAEAKVEAVRGQAAAVEQLPAALQPPRRDGKAADRHDDAQVQQQRPAHLGDDEDLKQAEDDQGDGQMGAHPLGMASAAEIGRAACRERVWQYVYISVVAVSLKKKKKNKMTQRTTNSTKEEIMS